MEQYKHWMWKRRKLNELSTNKDSWEEKAFAEDSAGILGDCIWPPRSYSCSFCRREFKSAQALGGHMNVHRRDRARLKQSSSPQNENFQHHHQNHHHQNPCTISLGDENQSQVCSLVYIPNPSSNPSVVRVSTSSTQDNCNEQTLVSPCSPTIVQQHPKGFLISPLSPCSTPSVNVNFLKVSDSKLEGDKNKSRAQEPGYQSEEDYVKTNSAISLNLVLFDSKLGSLSNKRRKIDSLPFSRKSGSIDICHLQSEVLNLIPSSMEELDLELRLGNLPKVVMIQY